MSTDKETVLVVDDNSLIRAFLQISLKKLGYSVLVAGDGDEALQIAESHEGVIDLLIADIDMPKMGGLALAENLIPLRPEIHVLYITGHWQEDLKWPSTVNTEKQLIEKPFQLNVLSQKIRQILD